MQILNDEMLEEVAGGATAIEYGLISSLIAVAIIGSLSNFGVKLNSTFNNINNSK